jgi:hypothetical protein
MGFVVDVSTYIKESGKRVESFPFDTVDEANEYYERSVRYDFKYESGDFRRTFEPREF